MAVAGIELWLIQAFCHWGSRAVFEYARDCQLASVTDVAVRIAKGLQLMEVRQSVYQRLEGGPELRAASERVFEEALEESVQGVSIEDLQADQVKEQIQGRFLDAARVGPVRFVRCAEVGMGKPTSGKRTQSHGVGGVGCAWCLRYYQEWRGADGA